MESKTLSIIFGLVFAGGLVSSLAPNLQNLSGPKSEFDIVSGFFDALIPVLFYGLLFGLPAFLLWPRRKRERFPSDRAAVEPRGGERSEPRPGSPVQERRDRQIPIQSHPAPGASRAGLNTDDGSVGGILTSPVRPSPNGIEGEALGSIQPDKPKHPGPVPLQPQPSREWMQFVALAVLVVGLPLLTYVALVNEWVAPITGSLYTEDEYSAGVVEGEAQGYAEGNHAGFIAGEEQGESAGFDAGYDIGVEAGRLFGLTDGYESGSKDGYTTGLRDGYWDGFREGCLSLFEHLDTTRIGSWWDYYYSPSYAYYYEEGVCG